MLMKVTDPNSVRVFDPRGVVETANTPIAVRPKQLDGLRLAILDNSKWNANKILRTSTAALEKSIKFAKVNYYVKGSFSKDAEPELIAEIAANNDLVLTAIGDCGSCCSCCIRDSVALERLGIPSAAIITTEFEKETVLTRIAIGMEGLIPVVIDHPVSSITQAEIESRAARIALQAPKVWLGQ
jgi:predicted DNA-binding protein (UPF0251 family)